MTHVFEGSADFVIPRFGGVVFIETGDFVEGRDRAPVVGWYAAVRVAD